MALDLFGEAGMFPKIARKVFIKYTTLGLRIPGYGAAEVVIDFTEELRHTETDPMCKIHEAVARHADIRDQSPSLGMICSSDPHQRNPNAPKFEDRSLEETEWQEQGARSSVEAGQKCV